LRIADPWQHQPNRLRRKPMPRSESTTARQPTSKKRFAKQRGKVLLFPGPRVGPELECPEEEFHLVEHCDMAVGDRVTVEIPIEVVDVTRRPGRSVIIGYAENGAFVAFESHAPKGVFAEFPAA
jgi:hypothetical protein